MSRVVNPRAKMAVMETCETCGAVVADRDRHEQWHADEVKRVLREQRKLARRA